MAYGIHGTRPARNHGMRTLMVVAVLLASAGSARAQARDTMDAIEHGRRAGREPIVGGYFLGGMVTGVTTLVSAVAILTGEGKVTPAMAVGPVAGLMLGTTASRSNLPLPASLAAGIADADSAYVAVFQRTYDETLRRRRARTAGAGVLAGIVGTVVLLVFGLRNYT